MPMPIYGGRDVSLSRNPATGLFDLSFDATGNFAFEDTDSHTVLSLLLEEKSGYVFDPTGNRGSLLHTVKLDRGSTKSDLESYAEDALDPAVNDGRIELPSKPAAKRVQPGKYDLDVKWRSRVGHVETLRLPMNG